MEKRARLFGQPKMSMEKGEGEIDRMHSSANSSWVILARAMSDYSAPVGASQQEPLVAVPVSVPRVLLGRFSAHV